MKTQINDKICPFCKGQNECMAHSESPCWCMDLKIPAELTELVPVDLKRKSCICISCVNSFKEDPETFKANFVH